MPSLLHLINYLRKCHGVWPKSLNSGRILLSTDLIQPLKQKAIKRVHEQDSLDVWMLWVVCHKYSIKVFYSWNLQKSIPDDSYLRHVSIWRIFISFDGLNVLLYDPLDNTIPCPVSEAVLLYEILWEPLKRVIIVPTLRAMRTHFPEGLLSRRVRASRPNMCIKLLDFTKLSLIIDRHGVKVNHLKFGDDHISILWVLSRFTLVQLVLDIKNNGD